MINDYLFSHVQSSVLLGCTLGSEQQSCRLKSGQERRPWLRSRRHRKWHWRLEADGARLIERDEALIRVDCLMVLEIDPVQVMAVYSVQSFLRM